MLQEAPVEIAEHFRKPVVAEFLRFGHGQDFDEEAGKLHEVIMRAPGMAVARPDREAEPPIGVGRGVEVAHGMDDMVEASGHWQSLTSP